MSEVAPQVTYHLQRRWQSPCASAQRESIAAAHPSVALVLCQKASPQMAQVALESACHLRTASRNVKGDTVEGLVP